MRFWAIGAGILGLALALTGGQRSPGWSIFISGNMQGYLSPCGCSDPMSGGIERRASAIRSAHGDVLYVDAGGLISGTGKQDRMKAETAIDAMLSMGVSAINLSSDLARLGRGEFLSLSSQAKGRFVSCQIEDAGDFDMVGAIDKGPFRITGASDLASDIGRSLGLETIGPDEAVGRFCDQAVLDGKTPVLLFEGSLDKARAIAKSNSHLKMIVYQSNEDPPAAAMSEGDCLLVSPGIRGRFLLRLGQDSKGIGGYSRIDLDPSQSSDAAVKQIYSRYLKRVDHSDLYEQIPRVEGAGFAGTAKCGSCHARELDVWAKSRHAHALRTLINLDHGRDPDCVSCHTVGLSFTKGFRSVKETPQLANVGCESCHGAGTEHSKSPLLHKMLGVTKKDCQSCHSADNSPKFDFASYWAKIRH